MNKEDNNRGFGDFETKGPGSSGLIQLALSQGLKLGGIFFLQALSLLLYRLGFLSSILFLLGVIAIPIFIYRIGISFRDNYLNGYARYFQVAGYLSWTYLASLIVAFLAFYLSFTILWNDTDFLMLMEESLSVFEELAGQNDTYKASLEVLRNMTSFRLARSLVFNALFNGLIYIYIISIFIKKKPSIPII